MKKTEAKKNGRPSQDRGPTWNKILEHYSKNESAPPLCCVGFKLGVSEQAVKLWLSDGLPEKFVCQVTSEVPGVRLADVVRISTVYPRLLDGDKE